MSGKTTFAQGQLRALVERLEEEKKNIAGDIKEVYAEAFANGVTRDKVPGHIAQMGLTEPWQTGHDDAREEASAQ